ncbi:MAG TPA: hypothetical protein ENI17_08605 [Pseudomonas xinjiangensis]|uniref:Uncharacterized protein n=2 Tax=root TaxID=1 RepID=A0A7V1BMG3_9GAMM|nr:hypothetical protein [Halopseudomonas xinjiangensis]HEC47673.1 hypothetical protein [Halopseudomonas xinjiangensis]
MNSYKMGSALAGKAFLIAAAVSLMFAGDFSLKAESEQKPMSLVSAVEYRIVKLQPASMRSATEQSVDGVAQMASPPQTFTF